MSQSPRSRRMAEAFHPLPQFIDLENFVAVRPRLFPGYTQQLAYTQTRGEQPHAPVLSEIITEAVVRLCKPPVM